VNTGGCLCGAVRYDAEGELRGIIVCHCVECLRWSGAPFAATAARRDGLVVHGEESLGWLPSPASERGARRGFCRVCGSSLFWDAPGTETVSIGAGTLDDSSGLAVIRHVYAHQAPAWDAVA